MMDYELISEEQYANLSGNDEQCFVEFESICRSNMTRLLGSNPSHDLDRSVREHYMAAVSAVAAECGIPNLNYNPDDENFWPTFSSFNLAVQGEVARIRIRQRGEKHQYSVLLTDSTRTKIDHYISRIRDLISQSEMDPDRRKRLEEKLDQLAKEVSHQRLSFAKVMAILVGVTTVIAGATTIAADGQSAIANIMRLIGQDKETEEAASKRLAPPPKALPAPQRRPPATPVSTRPAKKLDLDDDIPF
jgi:hypothetical protein